MTPTPKAAREIDGERLAVLENTLVFYQKQLEECKAKIDELEEKIEALERKKERLLGALGLIGFVWPFVSHWIYNLIK